MPLTSTRRLTFGGLATAAVLGAALLPAVATSASALEAVSPACPQTLAAVGFPVTATDIVAPVTPPTTLAVTLTGALPDGLSLYADAERAYVSGKPTKAQTATFSLTAKVTAGGTTTTGTTACTITVKPAPTVTRIAGKDRFEQSALVSKATFATADTVYLASGEKFPDALSAASVAADHSAPLLLTTSARVTDEVVAELKRLAPKDVVVVGGPLAVAPAVVDQLGAALGTSSTITRIGGADRFEVSRKLIGDRTFGIPASDSLVVATGTNFPDALGASPAAALADAPVLLVNGEATALTAPEKSTLTSLGVKAAAVVGGPLAVSAALEADLAKSYTTTRFGGGDRFEVNAGLNAAAFKPGVDTLYLASGANFPDALSGGAAAGVQGNPLAITETTCVSGATAFSIGRLVPSKVVILGGTASLGTALDSLSICPAE
ncbi:cell wall-binding repeat-containing protein [Herbiconiux sp. VKM Ac-1786]|uniref:cell wall-binding repeat-containing protein n=1 Tax=Herbiconiux sp. VKM Ac-1786 TaxID=2783824 RepID=UPI00188B31FB|nr:cell wall-binding repeat-containing protein [Herbiconiux sp. VKM Ac-1786]MBF4573220.1 cell wall-binding repeat-containing protein [Herbiconiux sp. VKM Ac-1786]